VVFLEVHDWATRTIVEQLIIVEESYHAVLKVLEDVV
jgi:hypothetical protein